MSTAFQSEYSLLESFREHVLSPITTAEQRVENELAEVAAERNAYSEFYNRVSSIETATTTQACATQTQRVYVDSRPRTVERVRNAFRTTVMSVDHYDEVYDESLHEFVKAELSADIVTLFQDDHAPPFTEHAKSVLQTAVQQTIDQRARFLKSLQTEQDSIATNRRALSDFLNEHDGPQVPDWYRSEFESTLNDIAAQRQETLRSRPSRGYVDSHDLCKYLYQDTEWTYPVLTAVTRFRRIVI